MAPCMHVTTPCGDHTRSASGAPALDSFCPPRCRPLTNSLHIAPAGTEIDTKGLRPDTTCSLGSSLLQDGPDGSAAGGDGSFAAFLPGMPVGVGSEAALVGSLARDKCVLTAANLIKDKTHMIQATAGVAAHLPNRL